MSCLSADGSIRYRIVTRLNQLLGVEAGVRDRAEQALAAARSDVTKDGPLSGLARKYEPRQEGGEQVPPQSTQVQLTVNHITDQLAKHLSRLWDVTATKDLTNTEARADIVVEGRTLVPQVPASYLVWFEKQLTALRGVLAKLPVLDPAEIWTYDEATGVYRTEPTVSIRPKKVFKNHVIAEATQYHPAQVQVYSIDEPEGEWTTTKFSGAIFATRRRLLVERIDTLIEAVAFARGEANGTTVTDLEVGAAVFDYLFAT